MTFVAWFGGRVLEIGWVCRGMELVLKQKLGVSSKDLMAFWVRQLYVVFVWFYCTPLNCGAGL